MTSPNHNLTSTPHQDQHQLQQQPYYQHQHQYTVNKSHQFAAYLPETSKLNQLRPTHLFPIQQIQQSPIRTTEIHTTASHITRPLPPIPLRSDNLTPHIQVEYPPLPPMHSYPMSHLTPLPIQPNYYTDHHTNTLQQAPISQQPFAILPQHQKFPHIQREPYPVLNYTPSQQYQSFYEQYPTSLQQQYHNHHHHQQQQRQNQHQHQQQAPLTDDIHTLAGSSVPLAPRNTSAFGPKRLESKLTHPVITEGSKIKKPAHKLSPSFSVTNRNHSSSSNNSNNNNNNNLEDSHTAAVNDYLNYHSLSIGLSKQLVWAGKITEELIKFSKYIDDNTVLLSFIEKEAKISNDVNLATEILNSNYKIEEFYSYIKNFPKNDLDNLFNICEKLSLMIKDWIKIKDSTDLANLSISYFLQNNINNGDHTTTNNNKNDNNNNNPSPNDNINSPLTSTSHSYSPYHSRSHSPSHSNTNSNTRSNFKNLNPKFFKPPTILNESVSSLQVVPFNPNENQEANAKLNSHGTLQPDLPLKVKLVCLHCGSTSTPEWRKGPEDAKTLCNACGLFHTKLVKKIGAAGAACELRKRRENDEPHNRRI